MWLSCPETVAHMAQLMRELKGGVEFDELRPMLRMVFESYWLIFIVPDLIQAKHSQSPADFGILRAPGTPSKGNLRSSSVREYQQ